jgi:hypothetical protein
MEERSDLWSDASRSDLRLLRRAVRAGWPIPEERWPAIRDAVFALLDRGNARLEIAVGWVFVEAVGANLRAERELRRQAPRVVVQKGVSVRPTA